MFPLLKLLLTVLYLSVFTVALPSKHQSPLSSPSTNPHTGNAICKGDRILCGDVCYDPTEADCDPQFLTLTRFGDHISRLKKEALKEKKLAREEKARRAARRKNAPSSMGRRAPPSPMLPRPMRRSARDAHAGIPPPS
ncbi:uncharacterized protein DFL_000249 [Arthrobotrys flagrans]|uniref:Uncharacterized protein n=1 Tax=Arthrobotrys flagrans TaxID=97331 RepID=A0A437AD75_ARTFL|nr:hypothetical protein DFL_000249 [Arthrobotrys flagrans]